MDHECCSEAPWSARDFLEHTTVVAELDGQLAAFVVLHDVFTGGDEPVYLDSFLSIAREVREREILNLAVRIRSRRLGIARALLEFEMQYPAVYYLAVRESNGAARRLYDRCGFVEIDRREHFYSLPAETAILMKANALLHRGARP